MSFGFCVERLLRMKHFLLIASVAAAPFADWLRLEKANKYITIGLYPCLGLDMPIMVTDSRKRIYLTKSTDLMAERVELAKMETKHDLMKIRCGDVAYALGKMQAVSADMTREMLEKISAEFIDLVKEGSNLRRTNFVEWLTSSRLIDSFANAESLDEIPHSMRHFDYTPFALPAKVAETRMNAKIGDKESAQNCQYLRIPGMDATLRVDGWLVNHITIVWVDKSLQLRPKTSLAQFTCGQLVHAIAQLGTQITLGLPNNIFEMRRALRDDSRPDNYTRKAGGMSVTLNDESKVMGSQNSLSLFCRPGVVLTLSSAHLEYEDKPLDFAPIHDAKEACLPLLAKVALLEKALSEM